MRKERLRRAHIYVCFITEHRIRCPKAKRLTVWSCTWLWVKSMGLIRNLIPTAVHAEVLRLLCFPSDCVQNIYPNTLYACTLPASSPIPPCFVLLYLRPLAVDIYPTQRKVTSFADAKSASLWGFYIRRTKRNTRPTPNIFCLPMEPPFW